MLHVLHSFYNKPLPFEGRRVYFDREDVTSSRLLFSLATVFLPSAFLTRPCRHRMAKKKGYICIATCSRTHMYIYTTMCPTNKTGGEKIKKKKNILPYCT